MTIVLSEPAADAGHHDELTPPPRPQQPQPLGMWDDERQRPWVYLGLYTATVAGAVLASALACLCGGA